MLLRFVGSDSEIGNIRVHEFGTLLDLDAQTAHDAVMSRVGLVPDADFTTSGITEEELTQYSDSHVHADATADFKQKISMVHAMAAKLHHEYVAAAATGDTFMTRAAKPAPKPVPTQPSRMDPMPSPAPKEQ